MSKKTLTISNWGAFAALFLVFLFWHGTFEGPLTPDEIDSLVDAYTEYNPEVDIEELRRFMEADDGRPVVMVNAIQLRDTPIEVNGTDFGTNAQEALEEYTSFVFPYLIKRGSYPLFSGTAVFDALEAWGIDDADEWSSGGLVRYRSRRVMMEMATDPAFSRFHDAKIAAIGKTIVYPTTVDISVGNLSLTVFLALFAGALGIQLLIGRNRLG